MIFLAPWAGARSDALGTRVPTLRITTLIAVGATLGMAAGPVTMTLILLGIGLVGFNVGSVVYDALLVDVSTTENRGRISGLGVGIGYIGSFIGLGIGVVTLTVLGWSFAATFKALALAFLIFALPAFFFIKEREGVEATPAPRLRDIVSRLVSSWNRARHYDGMVRFLVSRFLYTDAINTLIGGFLTIFVIQELGLDDSFVTQLLAVAVTAAVIGALVAGRFVESHGPLRVLRAALLMWMVAIASGIAAAVSGLTGLAWVIGPLGGVALGSTWTADRVLMTRISPPRHLGEFYGLYATVGRFATILGPLDLGPDRRRARLGATGGDGRPDPVHCHRLDGPAPRGRLRTELAARRPSAAQRKPRSPLIRCCSTAYGIGRSLTSLGPRTRRRPISANQVSLAKAHGQARIPTLAPMIPPTTAPRELPPTLAACSMGM